MGSQRPSQVPTASSLYRFCFLSSFSTTTWFQRYAYAHHRSSTAKQHNLVWHKPWKLWYWEQSESQLTLLLDPSLTLSLTSQHVYSSFTCVAYASYQIVVFCEYSLPSCSWITIISCCYPCHNSYNTYIYNMDIMLTPSILPLQTSLSILLWPLRMFLHLEPLLSLQQATEQSPHICHWPITCTEESLSRRDAFYECQRNGSITGCVERT